MIAVAMTSHVEDEQRAAENLGQRIAEMRGKRGLSQRQLGEKAGKSLGRTLAQNTVSDYEYGRRMPGTLIAAALAQTLGVSMDYLVSGNASAVPSAMLSIETETACRLMERLPERDRQDALERVREIYDKRERNKIELERLGRILESAGGPELRRSVEAAIGLRVD